VIGRQAKAAPVVPRRRERGATSRRRRPEGEEQWDQGVEARKDKRPGLPANGQLMAPLADVVRPPDL